jgi:hypothetical protein
MVTTALCSVLLSGALLLGHLPSGAIEDTSKFRGPHWRMPHAVQLRSKTLSGGREPAQHRKTIMSHLLKQRPGFVRGRSSPAEKWSVKALRMQPAGTHFAGTAATVRRSHQPQHMQALAGRGRASDHTHLPLGPAQRSPVPATKLLARLQERTLHDRMLAEQNPGEGEDAGETKNASGHWPFYPEYGAFHDWVLTQRPPLNMSDPNMTWGWWRTPENSNQYSGMTRAVPNNNPLGEQVMHYRPMCPLVACVLPDILRVVPARPCPTNLSTS